MQKFLVLEFGELCLDRKNEIPKNVERDTDRRPDGNQPRVNQSTGETRPSHTSKPKLSTHTDPVRTVRTFLDDIFASLFISPGWRFANSTRRTWFSRTSPSIAEVNRWLTWFCLLHLFFRSDLLMTKNCKYLKIIVLQSNDYEMTYVLKRRNRNEISVNKWKQIWGRTLDVCCWGGLILVSCRTLENEIQQELMREKKLLESRKQDDLNQARQSIEREKEELKNKMR